MATEILRPDGPGAECNISAQVGCSACPDHYDCVDEVAADEATTYLMHGANNWSRDLYSIEDSAVGAGLISNVRVYARCRVSGGAHSSLKIVVKSGVTTDEGSEHPLTTSWVSKASDWNTNPDTGLPWTWAEINSIQAGVSLLSDGATYTTQCTQVWITVTYTPYIPPKEGFTASDRMAMLIKSGLI